MERKALVGDCLQIIGLDNLARLVPDADFRAVKVSQHEVDTSEGLDQSDFMFEEQIGSLSLELLVRLFLHDNDDITGLLAWELVGFTVERELAVVGCALVDHGLENFLLLDDLLALANLAFVGFIDDFTLATAIVTRSLGLRVHSRAELLHACHDTATTASCALLYSALFATETVARNADTLTVYSNLGSLTGINLLKSALEWVHDGLALLGLRGAATATSRTTTTEHLAEQVIHAAATAATFLKAILTVAIVSLALLTVAEDFIGLLNLLELFLITTTIGMMSPGEFEVGLLNDTELSILFNAKSLVETCVIDLLRGATATGHAAEAGHIFLTHASEWEATSSSSKEHVCFSFDCSV